MIGIIAGLLAAVAGLELTHWVARRIRPKLRKPEEPPQIHREADDRGWTRLDEDGRPMILVDDRTRTPWLRLISTSARGARGRSRGR